MRRDYWAVMGQGANSRSCSSCKPTGDAGPCSDVEDGPRGFLRALWRSAKWCQWVEPSAEAKGEGKGVFFFRNRNGLGTPPMKLSAASAKKGMTIGSDSDAE